jgi:hypothetical protein
MGSHPHANRSPQLLTMSFIMNKPQCLVLGDLLFGLVELLGDAKVVLHIEQREEGDVEEPVVEAEV